MRVREITLTNDQAVKLRAICNGDGKLEGACQLLFGESLLDDDPWRHSVHGEPELRLSLHRLDVLPSSSQRRSSVSVSWDMDCFVKLLRKVREEALTPGICHSHPNSNSSFSSQDDKNESHLHQVQRYRNGGNSQNLISVLIRGDGQFEARVWTTAEESPQLTPVRVLGATFEETRPEVKFKLRDAIPDFLHRQALSVGRETVQLLQRLRVGVVGCGGTGSAVTEILTRIGVGHLLLIDADVVVESNLNRLFGSSRRDVKEKRLKIDVLRDHVDAMQLGTNVAVFAEPLANTTTARLLRSCDVVFGCTDDHFGRLILNRLAYFYLLPVIDMGLAVRPLHKNRPTHISGRVTLLRPGNACLLCRGIVDPQRAREQGLRYKHPDEYAQQLKEGYIVDTNIPTPVVATFTTETAVAAVNELLAGVAGLRGERGWTAERTIRYDLDSCRPTGAPPRAGCMICSEQDHWGVADVQPFLGLAGF